MELLRALADSASKLCCAHRELAAATAAATATATESNTVADTVDGLVEHPEPVPEQQQRQQEQAQRFPCTTALSREQHKSGLGALHDIVTDAVTERRGTSVLMCCNVSTDGRIWHEALPSLAQWQYSGRTPVLVEICTTTTDCFGELFNQILRRLHVDTSLAPAEVHKQLKAMLTKTEHSGSGTEEPMIVLALHNYMPGYLVAELQLCEMANTPNSRVIVVVEYDDPYDVYKRRELHLQLQHIVTI
jgi:hypothetical protein